MDLGVMFFSGSAATRDDAGAYELVLDVARFADEAGFANVWLPERHFTKLGSPYANPALLHAAVAQATERIGLRAGSVVLPLHSTLQVAEDWAILDVLSGGRVGISLASGWHANDFAFFPDRYESRHDWLADGIGELQRLWRGEPAEVRNGLGRSVELTTYPRPLQPELPMWLTAARRPETFAQAGRLGLNLLTHLLDQNLERLRDHIGVYREARAEAGLDPLGGTVTVMVHTYVGADAEQARAEAREPYCASIKENLGLLAGLAESRGSQVDVSTLSDREVDEFVRFLYDRFVSERALIGSPETCAEVVAELEELKVDEIACLLDFGPPDDAVRRNLPQLDALRRLASSDEGPGAAADAAGDVPGQRRETVAVPSADEWAEDGWTVLDGEDLYARVERGGAWYGPAMRCIERLRVRGDRVEGLLDLPADVSEDWSEFELPPVILDNAFLLLGAFAPDHDDREGLAALPVGMRRLEGLAPLQRRVRVEVDRQRAQESPGTIVADAVITDEGGRLLVRAHGVALQLVDGTVGAALAESPCYELQWTEAPDSGADAPPETPERWLVLGGPGDFGAELRDWLTARSERAELLDVGQLGPSPSEGIRRLLADAQGERWGVVCAWPTGIELSERADATALAAAQEEGVGRLLEVVQALIEVAESGQARARVWVLTRGAQGPEAGAPGSAGGPAQSTAWGFCRVLPHEHPDLWGGIIDLDPRSDTAAAVAEVGDVLVGAGPADQVVLRGSRRLLPRLVPVPDISEAGRWDGRPRLGAEGTWLLTGGAGDIGVALASRMVEWGARNLVLVSRRAVASGALEDLERAGARVLLRDVDVSDPDQVAALPDEIEAAGLPPVAGVVHLAGVAEGALLASLGRDQLDRVLAPKVLGAWNLHRVFGDDETPFVLISAIPAVIGPIGIGAANYAAANAFLDGFGAWRRERSLPTIVLSYGPWAEIGMAAREEDGLDLLARYGVSGLEPSLALDVLGMAWQRDAGHVAATRIDWAAFAASFPEARALPQYEALRPSFEEAPSAQQESVTAAGEELMAVPPEERRSRLRELMVSRLAAVLGLRAEELPVDRPVTELGLDSLMALEMRNRLEAHLGITIPMVQLLEGPSVESLVDTTSSLLDQAAPAASPDAEIEEFVL